MRFIEEIYADDDRLIGTIYETEPDADGNGGGYLPILAANQERVLRGPGCGWEPGMDAKIDPAEEGEDGWSTRCCAEAALTWRDHDLRTASEPLPSAPRIGRMSAADWAEAARQYPGVNIAPALTGASR